MSQCSIDGGHLYYEQANTLAKGIPVIVIHGGPGQDHGYLKPLINLLPNNPVVLYDQRDCGQSSHNNDTNFWSLEYLVKDLEQLRQHLNIDRCYIYAHSAGSLLGFDYALKYPQYIAGLMLASPVLSVQKYDESINLLVDNLPQPYRQVIHDYRADKPVNALDFMEANAFFAALHMCRLPVWPDELFNSSLNMNSQLRDYFWGPKDFVISGVFKDYERTPFCAEFNIPVLITCGEHDLTPAAACEFYAQKFPKANLQVIPNASHNAHLEQPELYKQVLNDFIISSTKG